MLRIEKEKANRSFAPIGIVAGRWFCISQVSYRRAPEARVRPGAEPLGRGGSLVIVKAASGTSPSLLFAGARGASSCPAPRQRKPGPIIIAVRSRRTLPESSVRKRAAAFASTIGCPKRLPMPKGTSMRRVIEVVSHYIPVIFEVCEIRG